MSIQGSITTMCSRYSAGFERKVVERVAQRYEIRARSSRS